MSVGSDLSALPLGRKLALIGGLGFFIVLFFPWVGVDAGDLADLVDVESVTDNGWDGVGVLAGVFAIALVAWELIRLFGRAPKLSVSADYITAGLAVLTALFGLIQFFRALTYDANIPEDVEAEFESLGIEGPDAGPRFGAFLGLLFVLVLAYAAYLLFRSGSRESVSESAGGMAGAGESPWPPADTGAAGGVAGAGAAAAAGGAAAGAAAFGDPDDIADTVDSTRSEAADTVDTAASSAAEAVGEPADEPFTEHVSAEPAAAPDPTSPLDAVIDEPDRPDIPPTER